MDPAAASAERARYAAGSAPAQRSCTTRPELICAVSAGVMVAVYGPAPLLMAVTVRKKEGSRQARTTSSGPSMRSLPPLGQVEPVPGVVQP